MDTLHSLSRRSFLTVATAATVATVTAKTKPVVGLELYSVRNEMKQDLFGTVKAVAKMGYEGVEFFSPYLSWTPEYTKEVRTLLNDLKMPCLSTHNSADAFLPANLDKTIELNKILGSKFVVMASAGRVEGLEGWKGVAGKLAGATPQLKAAGMAAGFHNHQLEFKPIDGKRPIEVIAENTPHDVVLQLDLGTCVEVGYDPAEWITKNKGRVRSIHCKEWSSEPGKGYKALFGEGNVPWKKVFAAAEKNGVEHYLIEQEGSAYPPLETAEKCLANFRKMHS